MLPAAAGMTVSSLQGRMLFGMLRLRCLRCETWRYSRKVLSVPSSDSTLSSSSPPAVAVLAAVSLEGGGGRGGSYGQCVGSFWRSQQEHSGACAPPMAAHKTDTTSNYTAWIFEFYMLPHT